MLAAGAKTPIVASLESALPASRVLLVFFKVNCPTCQLTLPFLERLHQSGRLAVRGISQNEAADTQEFAKVFGLTFPILLDSAAANYPASNAYGIEIVPSLFLTSADRTIEWTQHGFSRKGLEDLASSFETTVFRPGERVPEFKPG